jgi:asparagine synthase (glutamine-hydrolysing)
MPGISLYVSQFRVEHSKKKSKDNIFEQNFLEAIESVKYDKTYTHRILLNQDSLVVVWTGYPTYPIMTFEDDEFWVCVEGKIYGKNDSQLKKEISTILKRISTTKSIEKGDELISNWLLTTDGEFIIYTFDKKNKLFIVVNDALGRLPLYYYHDIKDTKVIISREMHLIAKLIWNNQYDNNKGDDKFDRKAIADCLLMGLFLEGRTLLANVNRLAPASILKLHNDSMKIDIQKVYTFNFEQKEYGNRTVKENSSKLVSLFSDACKNRADPNGNNVISISGGFDSRAVAACLYKNKIPFSTVTYVQPGWKPSVGKLTEVEIAQQVAKEFQSDCQVFGLAQPRAEDFLTLLKLKCGLNYLGYSYMIPILERLKQKNDSSITFFTGYGGDRLLRKLRFKRKLSSMDELINYMIRDIYGASVLFSIQDVAALTNMKEDDIIGRLRRNLASYPERSLDQKLVHFIFYEGVFSDEVESEDRNRAYMWSVSPYYSIPFFKYAMNCSDSIKIHMRLQSDFLLTLSPAAAAIKNAVLDCSITSKKYKLIQFLITLRRHYPYLKRVIDRIRQHKDYEHNSKELECLKDEVSKSELIRNYFGQEKLNDVMNNPEKYNATGIVVLFTIVSLMETLSDSQNTLTNHYGC